MENDVSSEEFDAGILTNIEQFLHLDLLHRDHVIIKV